MAKYMSRKKRVEAVQHMGDGKLDADGAIPLFDGVHDLMLPKGAWFVLAEDGRISVIGSKGFAEDYETVPEAAEAG